MPFSPYPKSGTPGELHGGVYGVPAMETWLAMGRPPTAICRPRVVLTIFKNENEYCACVVSQLIGMTDNLAGSQLSLELKSETHGLIHNPGRLVLLGPLTARGHAVIARDELFAVKLGDEEVRPGDLQNLNI